MSKWIPKCKWEESDIQVYPLENRTVVDELEDPEPADITEKTLSYGTLDPGATDLDMRQYR